MTQPHENLIDINLATLQELTTIHGIGPVLAARIIASGDAELTARVLAFQDDLRDQAHAKGATVRRHNRS